MQEPNHEAKRLFLAYTGGTGRIDALYGPVKASCRAHILSALAGERVPQRKSGWNSFRDAMYDLFEVRDEANLKVAALTWEQR